MAWNGRQKITEIEGANEFRWSNDALKAALKNYKEMDVRLKNLSEEDEKKILVDADGSIGILVRLKDLWIEKNPAQS